VSLALGALAVTGAHATMWAQTPPAPAKSQPAGVPAAELTEARKVEAATDAQGRLAAADAFLKKFPKTTLRVQVAQLVAEKIGDATDPAQLSTLADSFRALFNQPGEADVLNPELLHAYLTTKQFDNAFKLAATIVDKMPDPVTAMVELVSAGYGQLQQQNAQYAPQSAQYAARVIELIETDKKPAVLDDATWTNYKTKQLPQLYRLHGLLLYASGDHATAKTKLQRAIALSPNDMFAYYVLGSIRNEDYIDLVTKYKAATGAAQAEMLKQAETTLDEVIDLYAHVIALSEGNAQYQQIHDSVLQDLQTDYKYRHKNSLDGLQQLIDKYKQPAAAKP
jgi:tetratricopeptide (TPR) repeat protein